MPDLGPIADLQLSHQGRKQARKDLHRTRSIGGRERRSRYRAAAEMVKLAGVTFQAGFNLAQTPRAAKLRIQHRDQMGLGLYGTAVPVCLVLIHKPIEAPPPPMPPQ